MTNSQSKVRLNTFASRNYEDSRIKGEPSSETLEEIQLRQRKDRSDLLSIRRRAQKNLCFAFCIDSIKQAFKHDITNITLNTRKFKKAAIAFDLDAIEKDIKSIGGTRIIFANQGKLIRYWYAVQRLILSLAHTYGKQVFLAIEVDRPDETYAMVALPSQGPGHHLELPSNLMRASERQFHGAQIKQKVTLKEKPFKTIRYLKTLVPHLLQELRDRHNKGKNKKSKKKTEDNFVTIMPKVNNLEHDCLEKSPLQYVPVKFYCYDEHFKKYLTCKRLALLDSGGNGCENPITLPETGDSGLATVREHLKFYPI